MPEKRPTNPDNSASGQEDEDTLDDPWFKSDELRIPKPETDDERTSAPYRDDPNFIPNIEVGEQATSEIWEMTPEEAITALKQELELDPEIAKELDEVMTEEKDMGVLVKKSQVREWERVLIRKTGADVASFLIQLKVKQVDASENPIVKQAFHDLVRARFSTEMLIADDKASRRDKWPYNRNQLGSKEPKYIKPVDEHTSKNIFEYFEISEFLSKAEGLDFEPDEVMKIILEFETKYKLIEEIEESRLASYLAPVMPKSDQEPAYKRLSSSGLCNALIIHHRHWSEGGRRLRYLSGTKKRKLHDWKEFKDGSVGYNSEISMLTRALLKTINLYQENPGDFFDNVAAPFIAKLRAEDREDEAYDYLDKMIPKELSPQWKKWRDGGI